MSADPADLQVSEAISLVLASLELQVSATTHKKLSDHLRKFEKVLTGSGVERLTDVDSDRVEEFLFLYTTRHGEYRDPSASTVRNRRWALSKFAAMLAKLGIAVPALVGGADAPTRSANHPRPLTDDEMVRVREASRATLFESRIPTLVALAEITATPAEMAVVNVDDIDVASGRVRLRGAHGRQARINTLSAWGQEVVSARIEALDSECGSLLTMSRSGIEPSVATASIDGDLRRALNRACILDPEVRPSSIRAWSARKLFEKHGQIELVASWLGTPSLDTAAATIQWRWQS